MAPPAEASTLLLGLKRARLPILRQVLKPALLLAGLVAAGLCLRLVGAGALQTARPTPAGATLLILGGAALTAVGVPRQAVAFAGGYAFGAWAGMALAMIAQMLGCAAAYGWARAVAPGWVRHRLEGRIGRMLLARPFSATLALRLMPLSSNLLLNLAAGLGRLPVRAFLLATVLGYLPQTVIFSLAGSGVHLGAERRLAIGGALFLLSAALGWAIYARSRQEPLA